MGSNGIASDSDQVSRSFRCAVNVVTSSGESVVLGTDKYGYILRSK
jgi:hypothetical protein